MDSVIIAAGFGSRLKSVTHSKPLAQICGLSLIEIAIKQLIKAGVSRVFVVTGHMADSVEEILSALAATSKIEIESVRVNDWSVANGHSVIAGAKYVDGDYLLVMADHIFSSEIFESLRAQGAPENGVLLGVDRRLNNPLVDPDDATYVYVDKSNKIKKIGKDISDANAIDCGAFIATSKLTDAISAAIDAGQPGSLTDGMQWLADREKAQVLDIGDQWWMDVDNPHDFSIAQRELPKQLPHLIGL